MMHRRSSLWPWSWIVAAPNGSSDSFRVFVVVLIVCATVAPGVQSAKVPGSCFVPTQREDCGALTCISNRCVPCTNSTQCYFGGSTCVVPAAAPNQPPPGGQCLITPVQRVAASVSVGGAVIFLLWGLLAAIGSIGGAGGAVAGGALFLDIPVGGVVQGVLLHIFGNNIVRVPAGVWRAHPTVSDATLHRPVINYQILALFVPMATFGVVLGKVLDQVLLEVHRLYLLIFVQVLVIPFLVYKTAQRYHREQKISIREDGSPDYSAVEEMPTLNRVDFRDDLPTFPRIEIGILAASLILGALYRQFLSMTKCMNGYQITCILVAALTFASIFYVYHRRLSHMYHRDQAGRPLRRLGSHMDGSPDTWIDKWLTEGDGGVSFNFSVTTSIILPMCGIFVGISNVVAGTGSVVTFCLFALIKLHPDESAETNRLLALCNVVIPCLENLISTQPYNWNWTWSVFFLLAGAGGAAISVPLVREVRRRNWFFLVIGCNAVVQFISLVLGITLFVMIQRLNKAYGVPSNYFEQCPAS